jgi:hypothetical protein
MMFLSFIHFPNVTLQMKMVPLAIFGIIGAFFLLVAMATSRFRACKVPLGAVFLAGAGTTVFMVLTIACILGSPEMLKMMPNLQVGFLIDYLPGSLLTLGFFALGFALVQPQKSS